jgi:outer membrane cobalamin receptor
MEGTAGVHIRGGNASQTDLLIDGVRVFNVNHIGGFISAVPAYGVKDVTVYKGGVPSRFGGRLSGVVDISMRSGRKDSHVQEATIGTGLLRLGAEGPTGSKSSYIAHGRIGYPTLLYTLFSSGGFAKGERGDHQNFSLADLFAKWTYENRGWTVSATAFLSADWGFDQGDFSSSLYLDEYDWANQLYAVNARKRLGAKTTFLATLSHLRYGYDYDNLELRQFGGQDNRQQNNTEFTTQNIAATLRLTHTVDENIQLNGGVEGRIQEFTSGFQAFSSTSPDTTVRSSYTQSGNVLSTFGQLDMAWFDNRVNLMAGLRYDRFTELRTGRWQPRARLSAELLPGLFLNAGYDENVQFDHQLSTDLTLFPNELWVQSDSLLRPATARQVYAGFGGRLSTASPIQWSVEAFRKSFSSLARVQPGEEVNVRLDRGLNAEQLATAGTGIAEGLEFFLRKTEGDIQFWLAYTLSRSERTYSSINEGRAFPFTFDRRHDLSARVSRKLPRGWTLNGSFVFQSGIAFTAPIATTASFDIYSDFNNANYPPFHVLNVGADKSWTGRKRSSRRHQLSFSIYNLYNRANAYSIEVIPTQNRTVDPDTGDVEITVRKKVISRSLLPIVPGVSYRVTFN